QERIPHSLPLFQKCSRRAPRELSDPGDRAHPLGDGDGAPRLEEIEKMGAFDDVVVAGEDEPGLEEPLRLPFHLLELLEKELRVRLLEVEGGPLHLPSQEKLIPTDIPRPAKVHDPVHALEVAGDTLDAVGDFGGDRIQVVSSRLLKVRELRYLLAVEPDLPP